MTNKIENISNELTKQFQQLPVEVSKVPAPLSKIVGILNRAFKDSKDIEKYMNQLKDIICLTNVLLKSVESGNANKDRLEAMLLELKYLLEDIGFKIEVNSKAVAEDLQSINIKAAMIWVMIAIVKDRVSPSHFVSVFNRCYGSVITEKENYN